MIRLALFFFVLIVFVSAVFSFRSALRWGAMRIFSQLGMRETARTVGILPSPVEGSADPAQFGWQSEFERVEQARVERAESIRNMFAAAQVRYPPERIFLRAFKSEGELEMWARSDPGSEYKLVKTFSLCGDVRDIGPKRRQGDRHVPEGFYVVNRFNPNSQGHLSLGLNYPNESDLILGDADDPGGDIFIHGTCISTGCLTIDEEIKDLYVIWVDTYFNEPRKPKMPVHVYPMRMTESNMKVLEREAKDDLLLWAFWNDLRQGFECFEERRIVPDLHVDQRSGGYRVSCG